MAHPFEAYVGIPYETRKADCAALVKRVHAELYGHDIQLPRHVESFEALAPEDVRELIAKWAVETEDPREGDAVLMRMAGNTQSYGSHIGVLAEINGARWLLHAVSDLGSILTPMRHLGRMQLELVGYYTWTPATSTR